MTVGAVVVAADAAEALADAAGRVAVRRIVDAAWAGGALPIVVVSADPDGRVSAALGGSPAALVDPGEATGTQAYAMGARAALEAVVGTSALLLWPAHMTWVDPETVTSLLEASGISSVPRRPEHAGAMGWPVLLPAAHVTDWLAATPVALKEMLAGRSIEALELGDPGSVLGREVALDDLPAYAAPPQPIGGPPPEWGAAAAEWPDPEIVSGG